MKLLTHNMLSSRRLKNVVNGYPLGLVAKELKVAEQDFNMEFVVKMIPKLEWEVFWSAAKQIGHEGSLTKEIVADYESNETFLRDVHHALLEVDILEGELICPETQRKFPITDGIPNMLLKENES